MNLAPHLPIAMFARARAALAVDPSLEKALEPLGLDESGWRAEEEAWLALLADDLDRGDLARVRAYNAAYEASYREVTGLPTPVSEGDPWTEPIPPFVSRPTEKATYQLADEHPAPDPRPAPAVQPEADPTSTADETAAIDRNKLAEGLRLPFVSGEMAPFRPKPSPPKRPDESGDTAPLPRRVYAPTRMLRPDEVVAPSAVGADDILTTIDEYVAIVVGLGNAADPEAFLTKHRLTRETWVTASRAWSDRMRKNSHLAKMYDELLAEALKRHAR